MILIFYVIIYTMDYLKNNYIPSSYKEAVTLNQIKLVYDIGIVNATVEDDKAIYDTTLAKNMRTNRQNLLMQSGATAFTQELHDINVNLANKDYINR